MTAPALKDQGAGTTTSTYGTAYQEPSRQTFRYQEPPPGNAWVGSAPL